MLNNITLHVAEDYNALSNAAAQLFAKTVNENPTGTYGFATGGTPEGMYQQLIKMSEAKEINLTQITAFNLDEYVSLSQDNPQSYYYYMATKLFDAAGVPLQNRHIPNGGAPCPIEESAAYEKKIIESGGIDFQILGIGTNGHIGFNEPADTFAGQTSYVALAQETIDANARYFDDINDVPKYAISMGIQTIMMAKKILLLASGDSKAKIMREALMGPITPKVPASALQMHQNVIVVADKAAAKYLVA
ncbi:MAG: glucosamine-6-phosphate deaminase [Firmicutes bacterium]|nr:glucosamine-6-phosphate deaminase [Bacillota bacterium]